MIGKDMTKMTLPVSFNEPTSLLQRVTEDMVSRFAAASLQSHMTDDLGSLTTLRKKNERLHACHRSLSFLIIVLGKED